VGIGGYDVRNIVWKVRIYIDKFIKRKAVNIFCIRTPFVKTTPTVVENIPEGDDEESYERKRMYERILAYKDDLKFIRRASLSPNMDEDISDETKNIIRCLIKSSKASRLTAKQLLLAPYFSSFNTNV
jgi:serine/threonine protein kinase